jgi:glycosyltransferase involved in cell wall biosynthesis
MSEHFQVSVIMITYNHEKYITQAIEGVLMQECDFGVELILANDNSPDNTDDVVTNYLSQKDIPKNIKINYTKHKANKGMHPNFVWATEQCKGKYIAMCEGDDYWTDPLKLQKQVNFLETNEDYVLIHSDIFYKKSGGEDVNNNFRNIISKIISLRKGTNIVRYLVKGNYIMTLTVLITKNALHEALEKIAENDNQVAFIYYTLFLELSQSTPCAARRHACFGTLKLLIFLHPARLPLTLSHSMALTWTVELVL